MKFSTMEGLWLGDLELFMRVFEMRQAAEAQPQLYMVPQEDDEEDDPYEGYGHLAEMVGNVAVVNVSGSLVNAERGWHRYFQGEIISYEAIRNAVHAVARNREQLGASSILMAYDTPGGAVTGIGALGDFLRLVDEKHLPVYSHTSSVMASGGMWLGSYGREVTADRLAQVGSVGVISIHMEITKMLEKMGVQATVLREGKFKALGNQFEPLTEEAKVELKRQQSAIFQEFKGVIANNMGLTVDHVTENVATGRVFFGFEAQQIGLVNRVLTFDEVVNQLNTRHNSRDDSPNSIYMPTGGGMKTKVMTEQARAAIASGLSEEEALAKFGADAEVADEAPETSAPETEEENAEAGEAPEENVEAEAPAPAADAAPADTTVNSLVAKIADLSGELAVQKAGRAAAETQVAALQTEVTGLKAVAAHAINRVQISLRQAPADLSHLDGASLVALHGSVESEFQKQYPVGAQARTPVDANESGETTWSEVHKSRVAAARIGQ